MRAPGPDHHADLYAVLGVARAATGAEIRRAYRKLALAHHPDRAGAASADVFARIAEAYHMLSDPTARTAYDAHLFERERAFAPGAAQSDARAWSVSAVGWSASWRKPIANLLPRLSGPIERVGRVGRGADRPRRGAGASPECGRGGARRDGARRAGVADPLPDLRRRGQAGRRLVPALRACGAGHRDGGGGGGDPAGGARRAGRHRDAASAGRLATAGTPAGRLVTRPMRILLLDRPDGAAQHALSGDGLSGRVSAAARGRARPGDRPGRPGAGAVLAPLLPRGSLPRAGRAARRASPPVASFRENADQYLATVDAVVRFLQGRDPELAVRIVRRRFLPEGPRFVPLARALDDADAADPLAAAYRELSVADRAKHLASLDVDDVADAIRDGIDPRFELSRYAEKLATSAASFDPLATALDAPPTLVDQITDAIGAELCARHRPDVVGISAPFPGNVYGAFRLARAIKRAWPVARLVSAAATSTPSCAISASHGCSTASTT